MYKMEHTTILTAFIFLFCLQSSFCGIIRREDVAISQEEARNQFESEARTETLSLLNNLFRSQRDFFAQVKAGLAPQTKRASDIGKFIEQMNTAIAESDVKAKDRLWRESFEEFHNSPLLLNRNSETGLTDEEYEKLLDECGLKNVVSNFLTKVTTYFWKMARASGKVVEVTIDEQLEKLKNVDMNQFSFFF